MTTPTTQPPLTITTLRIPENLRPGPAPVASQVDPRHIRAGRDKNRERDETMRRVQQPRGQG